MQIYLQQSEKELKRQQTSSKQVRKPWYQLKKQLRLKVVKKDYERFYEHIYSFDKNDPTFVKKREAFTFGTYDPDVFFAEYADVFRNFHLAAFDTAVKLYWYRMQVKWHGRAWIRQSVPANLAKIIENYKPDMLRTNGFGQAFPAFNSYIPELFPDIKKKHIEKHKDYFKFPFTFISPAYLLVVVEMETERMFLLQNAEKRRMNYAAFLDYVANFVLCCNQELGHDVFALLQNEDGTFKVSDLSKKPR